MACALRNVHCRVPVRIEHFSVGADVAATAAFAVAFSRPAVGLARVRRRNCLHLLSKQCCLLRQTFFEMIQRYLREGSVVRGAHATVLPFRGLLLNLREVLEDKDVRRGGPDERVDGSVDHVL